LNAKNAEKSRKLREKKKRLKKNRLNHEAAILA